MSSLIQMVMLTSKAWLNFKLQRLNALLIKGEHVAQIADPTYYLSLLKKLQIPTKCGIVSKTFLEKNCGICVSFLLLSQKNYGICICHS